MSTPVTVTWGDIISFVFADQYRTLALYGNTHNITKPKGILESFVLRERTGTTAVSKFWELRYASGTLTISDLDPTAVPADNDAGWRTFSFDVVREAADVWVEGQTLVIGMGDIRGGFADIAEYDFATYPVIIT